MMMMSTMMIPAIMEDLNVNRHLVVAIPGQPQDHFEVTEVIQQGTSLILQCQPVEKGNDPEPFSHQDHTDRVFITDGDAEPLSFHDPRRFYEDLR
jgi:hypothetical protein